jgi:hypothetical protein
MVRWVSGAVCPPNLRPRGDYAEHLVPRRGSSPPTTIVSLARHTVRALTNARLGGAHSHSTASASARASGVPSPRAPIISLGDPRHPLPPAAADSLRAMPHRPPPCLASCLAWVNCQVVMPWSITDGVSATAGRDMCTVTRTRRVARGACSIGRARLGSVEHSGAVEQGQGGL